MTVKVANKLRTAQRAIERLMLGITLEDRVCSEEIRRQTKVEDIIQCASIFKWYWVRHVARQQEDGTFHNGDPDCIKESWVDSLRDGWMI